MAVGTEDKGKVIIKWISTPENDSEGTYVTIYCHVEVRGNKESIAVTDIDNADKYVFEVRRYKDKATKEEYLNVRAYSATIDGDKPVKESDEVCGEVEKANILELESKLINLRVYGVMLGRKHFPKIRQLIEKVYPSLTPRTIDNSTLLTKDVINAIYEMFVQYIKEVGMTPDNGLYNIPVSEFKEYIEDTQYSKYKYSDIRSGLANFTKVINGEVIKGTKCSYGRNDNTIAKGDKRIKVISFVGDVVDSYQITKLPEA